MPIRVLTILALAAAAFAQRPAEPPDPAELKAYLNLSDQQIASLQALRTQQAQALAAVFQQIRTKQTALEQTLAAPGATAAAVGQMLLDILALRQQITQSEQQYRTQAVALLTADQKARLQSLADAQKLQAEVREAESLNLLTPASGAAIGGPGPGPRFGGGMFPGRGRMAR